VKTEIVYYIVTVPPVVVYSAAIVVGAIAALGLGAVVLLAIKAFSRALSAEARRAAQPAVPGGQ